MKKNLTCVVLIMLIFATAIMFTSCALKSKEFEITAVKNFEEYDNQVKIFVNGEEMLEYFEGNDMYHLSSDFNQQIETMIATHYFNTKSIVFLTISDGNTGMSVQAIQNNCYDTVKITFKIKYGMNDDISAKFFFFEIPKTEKLITFEFK